MNAKEVACGAVAVREALWATCSNQRQKVIERGVWRGTPDLSVAGTITDYFRRALRGSQVVLWDRDVFSLAVSGHASFDGLRSSDYLGGERPEFWWFHDFSASDNNNNALAEVPAGYDHECLLFFPAAEDRPAVVVEVWMLIDPVNKRADPVPYLRATRADVTLGENSSRLAACRAFMSNKLAAAEPVKLPRTERRLMLRAQIPIPDIRVVQLRGREASVWHSPREAGSREYHNRWIVKGHWRRLHEPRKSDGADVVWVNSYIKGPEGAPLLETVFAVTR